MLCPRPLLQLKVQQLTQACCCQDSVPQQMLCKRLLIQLVVWHVAGIKQLLRETQRHGLLTCSHQQPAALA